MSSNNVSLAISVTLNLILLACFYWAWSDLSKATTDNTALKSTVQEREAKVKEMDGQITTLKNKMGLQQSEIGTADDAEAGTVMGGLNGLIALGKDVTKGEQSVLAAVRKMDAEIANLTQQLEQRQLLYDTKVQEYNSMVAEKAAEVDTHQKAAEAAQEELKKNVQVHSEAIDAKDRTIAGLRTDLGDAQAELEKVRSELTAIIALRDERIAKQSNSLVRLRRQIFEQEDLSFEKADGRVVFVDTSRQVVTISLGEADGLRPGVTFSVYQKDNSGIGRRNMEDIKGKIEVTTILGAHRAEARILDPSQAVRRRADEEARYTFARRSDYYQRSLMQPVAIGDPIYSPAFSVGTKIYFSLVGLVDLDGDGNSDRDLLRNLVRSAGAEIDNEIGDDGEPVGELKDITYRTRFLVVGDLGDQDKTEDTEKLAIYQKIAGHAQKMREQAMDAGIRVVSLPAFIDYLGYQASAGAWRKGEDFKATLNNGATSEGVNRPLGNRGSQGNVSGLFHADKRRTQNLKDRLGRQGATGTTSGLYDKDR